MQEVASEHGRITRSIKESSGGIANFHSQKKRFLSQVRTAAFRIEMGWGKSQKQVEKGGKESVM